MPFDPVSFALGAASVSGRGSGGGGSTFVVHLTSGDDCNETVENASEIIAAYESGKSMLCDWPGFYYIEVYTTSTGKGIEMTMISSPESANNSIEIVKYYGSLSEADGYDKPFELSGEDHYIVALTPDD